MPAARALVETFIELTHQRSLPEGLAALYVYESQIPTVAEVKIDGLRRFYGITNSDGLRFFSVHRAADPHHAQTVGGVVDARRRLA